MDLDFKVLGRLNGSKPLKVTKEEFISEVESMGFKPDLSTFQECDDFFYVYDFENEGWLRGAK